MYCVNCGVKLADTEKKCPLCETVCYHPDIKRPAGRQLYPGDKMPQRRSGVKALGGAIIILYLIPLILCFFSDMHPDGMLDWFGFIAGGLAVSYVMFALPLWFKKPNPVIFVPCGFAAVILYLFYINIQTGGHWFLSFAFPITGALGLTVCAVVTLLRYLRRGRLYIIGGALMALGGTILLTEELMAFTFALPFIGWSVYPFIVLILLGGLLVYLAIDGAAREVVERKLFF